MAPKSHKISKKSSMAALLGKKSSKTALKANVPATDNPSNDVSPVNPEQSMGTIPDNSRTNSEQTSRVTFAPLPERHDDQNLPISTGPDSNRTSEGNDGLSHASKGSAGSSTFKTRLKGLLSKKSSKNLRKDVYSAPTETMLNEPHDPVQLLPESPYVNDPVLGPYRGRTLMRPVHAADSSNEDRSDVGTYQSHQVQGRSAGTGVVKSQSKGKGASLNSMIPALQHMNMKSKRNTRPGRIMLAPKEKISAPSHKDQIYGPAPFWEDIHAPKPLYVGKYRKPRSRSTSALRDKLAYRTNPETGLMEPQWKRKHDLQLVKTVAIQQLRNTDFPRIDEHQFRVQFSSEDSFMRQYSVKALNVKTGSIFECSLFLCLPQFPRYKLLSMISTMVYVEKHTNLPVPLIISFNLGTQNPFSMEFFMMKKPKGKTYASLEASLSIEAKKTFARSVANTVDQLSKLRFSDIGSLFHEGSREFSDTNSYYVGTLTEPHTTRDMRVDYDLRRGPYSTLLEFYNAQIEVVRLEAKDPRQKDRLEHWLREMPLPEGDGLWEFLPAPTYTYEDHKLLPTICEALQAVLPLLVSNKELDLGATRVYHFNLSKHNLLINDDGEIVGIVGWESAWVAPPALIQKYPLCIPDLNEENPEPHLDFGSDEGNQEWEDFVLGMEFVDRLRELGSAHLDVMNYEKSSKVAKMELFLRRPPSMETFMKFLDSIDKNKEEAVSQHEGETEG